MLRLLAQMCLTASLAKTEDYLKRKEEEKEERNDKNKNKMDAGIYKERYTLKE